MRILASVCNVCFVLFTLFVLLTDGPPTEALSVGLTLLVLAVPTFTALVLLRPPGSGRPSVIATAAVGSFLLLAAGAFMFATRYPSHPKEPGLLPYVLLALLAPILGLVALLREFRQRTALPGR